VSQRRSTDPADSEPNPVADGQKVQTLCTLLRKRDIIPAWAQAPNYREEIAMLVPTTPVAGYIRVSTQEQAEHGNGLAAQEEAIRTYCDQHRLHLVRIYEDGGVSGGNGIEDRVALPRMLSDLYRGDFEAIVVARLDRLARKIALQEAIVEDLRKHGGLLLSVAEPDLCSEDPARILMRQMLGVFAEYERNLITARLTAGRRRKKCEGGYTGELLPLGYRVKGQGKRARVVVVESEAEVVQMIFDLYEQGLTMRQIARRLTQDGVRTKRGGTWRHSQIKAILANEAYCAGQYPPIIDRVQWEACTSRRRSYFKRNREQSVA
jgi:site-specific DNA recombinase